MNRRTLASPFLRLNRKLWNCIPERFFEFRVTRLYGRLAHAFVRRSEDRRQFFGTYFLRNRPQLELIRRLSYKAEHDSLLNIAVLGCSNGAEVYSVLSTLRMARPELKVSLHALDISKDVLELASKGSYSLEAPALVDEPIFQRMTAAEIELMFDRDGDTVTVKPWIKEGIRWHLGDVRDSHVLQIAPQQDLVLANNFLCHMKPRDAEACLQGVARFVRSGGFLIVSGIDLNVRAKVALEQGWRPVAELLQDIHNADSLRKHWPVAYWGLEPLDKRRRNWETRYATVFQIGNGNFERCAPEIQSGDEASVAVAE